jgi:hypothetical protein
MIEGIKIKVKGSEIKTHLLNQMEKAQEMLNSPLHLVEAQKTELKQGVRELKFMADHIVADDEYLLDAKNVKALGIAVE